MLPISGVECHGLYFDQDIVVSELGKVDGLGLSLTGLLDNDGGDLGHGEKGGLWKGDQFLTEEASR